MREITTQEITNAVAKLCIQANKILPKNLENKILECAESEESPVAKAVFDDLIANLRVAKEENFPICQDTGMTVVFVELGQDVHITGGTLREAVNAGVAKGYTEGYLRCSVVGDPLERVNTKNNTPAVLHLELVEGEQIKITVCPKGFGSENMSQLKMMTPAVSHDDIIQYVTDCIAKAGSNPCPPIVVGVGIGGNFEECALLAKKALCRDANIRNPKPLYAELESKMLENINQLGIGAQGFGGTVTALYVNIEEGATHIAGLPVAVNVGCHVTRHAETIL
ncbi:MAG: fumarate hydratase [Oscillospiraceae bacterium]|nr:fumarate hydratase [Oscillospiraceae bacterium]